MTENDKIEKFKEKSFSPHYTLEISLSCRNCGTFKERWMAASDGPTAFPFILTICEYCGCFRFDAVLHAKFFDNRDEKNLQLAKSKHGKEIQADTEAQNRLLGPKVIKKVEGERMPVNWKPPIVDDLPERETPEGLMGTPPYDHSEEE